MLRETRMQSRAMDVCQTAATQVEAAKKLKLSPEALRMRLYRRRKSNGIYLNRARRPKHKRAIRFVQLSTLPNL